MIKKILKITGIVVLVVLIAAITLPFIYKDKIIAKVKEEVNKNVNAKVDFGTFDLGIIRSFPDFTFTLNDLKIVGVNEFKDDTLASIKSLNLRVDIMSVIKGERYEVKNISIETGRIFAKVLKNGKANWDIAKPSTDTKAATSEPTKFKLALKRFAISNSLIVYDDASMGAYIEMVNFNHELKGDFTQDLFLMQTLTTAESMSATYGGVKYLNKVNTRLKADLDMDMPKMKFSFKENELSFNDLTLGFDGYVAMLKDMEMDLKFGVKKSDFKTFLSLIPGVFTKDFKDLKTSGKLAFEGYAKGVKTDKKMPAFGLNLQITNGMFQYPALPTAVNNVQVDLKVSNADGDLDHTVVNLAKMHVEIGAEPFDAKMIVTTPVSDANIDASVVGKINLANMSKIVPLETGTTIAGLVNANLKAKGRMSAIEQKRYEDFNAAGTLTVTALKYTSKDLPTAVNVPKIQLTFNPKNITLNDLDARIGKSDIRMNGELENFIPYAIKGQTLIGKVNFSSTLLDLNDLMADSKPKPNQPAKTDSTPMAAVAIPANIDFTMNVSIGSLLYTNMEMNNMKGSIVVKDAAVKMQNLNMQMLGGTMAVNGAYDSKNIQKPTVDFDLGIKDFDIARTYKTFNTVKKMASVGEKASGKFSMTVKFAGDLDKTMQPVMNTLNGGGTFMSNEVKLDKFEPIAKVTDALKIKEYQVLNLKDLKISFKFANGRINVAPFDLNIGPIKSKFGGSSGFDQTIDYVMAMEVPTSVMGGAASSAVTGLMAQLNSKAGTNLSVGDKISVDALITGTSTKPSVKLAMKGSGGKSITDDLKDKAKAEADRLKAEAEAKVKAETDKLKQQANDNVNAAKAQAQAEADRVKKEAQDKANAEAEKAKQKAKDAAKDKLKGLFGPK